MNRDRLIEQRGRHIYRQPDVTTTPPAEDEGEYDDVWPVRLPSSARRYQDGGDQQGAQGNGRPGKSVIPPRSSLQGQQDISPPIHLIHGVPHVNIGGQWVEVVTHENAPPPVRKQQQRKTEEPMPVLQVNDQVASKPRTHWLLYIGIVMLLMLVGWTLVTMFLSWWQVTTDDWHYGRPRSYQVDQRVGHGDAAIPSHFIAMNLAHHVQVIECPAGDCTKAIVYIGPQVIGDGQDLAVVTITFKDVNGDGKLDMIVNVQESHFIFLNDNGRFRPARPGENVNV